MFKCLVEVVNDYNNSNKGKAILQEYDLCIEKVFILYGLINWVHEKILQFNEICYVDTSTSFELLNMSITLLYISYVIEALLFRLFIISDEFEIILEKAINLLKMIFSQYTFFGYKAQIGLKIFFTNDSNVECNALELC